MTNPVLDYGYSWKHLDASTQVSLIPGILHSVTINRPDPAGGCSITLYDSVAGVNANIIAVIAMDSALFVVPVTLIYDTEFLSGLYVEFSAGFTVGDITVSYR